MTRPPNPYAGRPWWWFTHGWLPAAAGWAAGTLLAFVVPGGWWVLSLPLAGAGVAAVAGGAAGWAVTLREP